MPAKNLSAALAYASKGWRVFPLRPKSKAPLSAHGFHDATTNRDQIRKWWMGVPAAGIGVATGHQSGLLVLDIDPRNGGEDSLKALTAQYGELPPTVVSKTGGGGVHYFFNHPGGVTPGAKGLWQGIDVKSDGGYVAVPFTLHPSGFEYRWENGADPGDVKIQDAPPWLLEALEAAKKRKVPAQVEESDEKVIVEGNRNDSLSSLAGTMQRRGMSYEAILRAILAENEARCVPPLDEIEVEALVRSITRYPADPGSTPGVRRSGRSIEWVPTGDFLEGDPPPVEWIIEDRLAQGDCALLAGPPGAGKSWLTMELAVTTAACLPIMGKFERNGHGPKKVMVVDEENPQDEVHRRLRALITAWEITPAKIKDHLYLARPCQGFTFKDASLSDALKKQVELVKPDIIIFDSIIAISDIENENDAVQVRRFFHDQLYPLRAISGATILCVHHTSKAVYQHDRQIMDQGLPRGSIDFSAAADSCMLLEPSPRGGLLRLESLKVRRGRVPGTVLLEIVDGEQGGARPLCRSVAQASPQPGDAGSSKAARCRQHIVEVLQGKVGKALTGTDLSVWVRAIEPELTEADIRMALAHLVSRGMLSKEDDPQDKRTSKYSLIVG